VIEEDSHMRLSHEIIVLDYGDERSSPYDLEKKVDQTLRKGNSEFKCLIDGDTLNSGEKNRIG
jgi:hypothetical protein